MSGNTIAWFLKIWLSGGTRVTPKGRDNISNISQKTREHINSTNQINHQYPYLPELYNILHKGCNLTWSLKLCYPFWPTCAVSSSNASRYPDLLASTLTLTQVSNGHKSFGNSELVKIDWTFGTSCMAVLEEEKKWTLSENETNKC